MNKIGIDLLVMTICISTVIISMIANALFIEWTIQLHCLMCITLIIFDILHLKRDILRRFFNKKQKKT